LRFKVLEAFETHTYHPTFDHEQFMPPIPHHPDAEDALEELAEEG